MELSSGVSQINLNGGKVFLWPKYNQSLVDPVKAIDNYARQNDIYRADPLELDNMIKRADNSKMSIYNSRAEITAIRTASVIPGSLFDAFA